jgi:putative methyltransferase (TIGR04325 family)
MKIVIKILRLLTPPIFIKILSKYKFQYKGKYNSLSLCKKMCMDGLSGKKSRGVYFDKQLTHLLLPDQVVVIDRFAITSVLAAMLKKKLTILDVGGANQPIICHIKQTTNLDISCYVLETPQFIKNFAMNIPKNLKIKYIDSINIINKKIDIVVFNGAIQYLSDYKEFLKKIFYLKPKYIIITRTNFHNKLQNYYSIETGLIGSSHPYLFFSFPKLKSFFLRNNYQLIFDNKYNIGKYKHLNVKSDSYFHKDLIFSRN